MCTVSFAGFAWDSTYWKPGPSGLGDWDKTTFPNRASSWTWVLTALSRHIFCGASVSRDAFVLAAPWRFCFLIISLHSKGRAELEPPLSASPGSLFRGWMLRQGWWNNFYSTSFDRLLGILASRVLHSAPKAQSVLSVILTYACQVYEFCEWRTSVFLSWYVTWSSVPSYKTRQ